MANPLILLQYIIHLILVTAVIGWSSHWIVFFTRLLDFCGLERNFIFHNQIPNCYHAGLFKCRRQVSADPHHLFLCKKNRFFGALAFPKIVNFGRSLICNTFEIDMKHSSKSSSALFTGTVNLERRLFSDNLLLIFSFIPQNVGSLILQHIKFCLLKLGPQINSHPASGLYTGTENPFSYFWQNPISAIADTLDVGASDA